MFHHRLWPHSYFYSTSPRVLYSHRSCQAPQWGAALAIGECLYRVVARALLFEHRDALRSFFSPDQFAVATPAGCEALALGARCLSEAYPTHTFLQLDVANAFNTISHSAVFEGVRDTPLVTILPFVRSFYSFAAPLHCVCRATRHVVSLLSSTGTRQGDPLSAALFAFGLRTALSKVQARTPAALICTSADDTMIHGPPDIFPAAFQAYVEEVAAVGLSASINKCRVWLPSRRGTSGGASSRRGTRSRLYASPWRSYRKLCGGGGGLGGGPRSLVPRPGGASDAWRCTGCSQPPPPVCYGAPPLLAADRDAHSRSSGHLPPLRSTSLRRRG